MSHFGVLSYKGTGHLNPLIALSRRLVARGHRVTFILDSEMEHVIRQHELGFMPISSVSTARESKPDGNQQRPSAGVAALQYRVRRVIDDMDTYLRNAPAVLRRVGVDALIIDEIALAGPTLAELLRLPYFLISTSVPHHFGWHAASRIAPRGSFLARIQKSLLEISILKMRGPVRRYLDRFRIQAGLQSIRTIRKTHPELAHITQLPQCLDYPRLGLPRNFHYTGPFVDEDARVSVKFPWERLDGRRLVYASLGTTLKGDPKTFRLIAEACAGLNVQLVISLGDRRDPAMLCDLPGDPIVVRNAPQLELLKRAELVITHAGPNTAFEALMHGRPMIAIPKTFDQPAIASRLEWLGAAEVLSRKALTATKIRAALDKVLSDDHYRDAAVRLQAAIGVTRGLESATRIIEESMAENNTHLVKAHAAGRRLSMRCPDKSGGC